jgi:branched-subunit amino acid transport protein AzlD
MKKSVVKAAFLKSLPVLAGYVVLQAWKRSSLVSILSGTVIYMVLIQVLT